MATLPKHLREFDDTGKTRELIYENALDAVKRRFPIEDDQYSLELHNVRYSGKPEFTWEQQKDALMKNRQLRRPIKGKWRLIHKESGKVLDERDDTVMHVPYYTPRGTFIYNGNEYTMSSQSRLKAGPYVRRRVSGDVETHFNVKPGTGKGFHIRLEPSTGVFKLNIGQSNIPIYPVLKAIGVSDEEIEKSIGTDLLRTNRGKRSTDAVKKVYRRISGYKYDPALDERAQAAFIRDALQGAQLDPDVVGRTMGVLNTKNVTPALMLRAMQKMLNVNKGEEQEDDRDSPKYSSYHGVEDYVKERVDKDAGKLARSLLFKARRNRSLKSVPSGALSPYMKGMLLGSGLAMPLEETNPISILEQLTRITKLGEGGIGSAEAVTMSARNVNPGQFGFIDPIMGPEGCWDGTTEVMTRDGWVRWAKVTEETEFACNVDGAIEFHKPQQLFVEDYAGMMYRIDGERITEFTTPSHKFFVKEYGTAGEYRWEHASAMYGKPRCFRVLSDKPYAGNEEFRVKRIGRRPVFTIPIDQWCRLIAYYLNFGSMECVDDMKCVRIFLPCHIDYIFFDRLIEQLPFPYAMQKIEDDKPGLAYDIYNGAFFKYIDELEGSGRNIPDELFDAPVTARAAFLDTFNMASNSETSISVDDENLAIALERFIFGMGMFAEVYSNTDGTFSIAVSYAKSTYCKSHDYSQEWFSGLVYCATVPGNMLYVRRGAFGAHWAGNLNIGIDVRAAYKTYKGADGNLYGEFTDRNGKTQYLTPAQVSDSIVAFPAQLSKPGKFAVAMVDGKIKKVPKNQVQYELPSTAHMLAPNMQLNPMPTAFQPGRAFYGAKFWGQYMPQVKGEKPLVTSLVPGTDESFHQYYGKKIGTFTADKPGQVIGVTKNNVKVKYNDGETKTFELVNNFPFNRLSAITFNPTVKAGDKVSKGSIIAHSNFTDKDGNLKMGVNLKTAVLPYRGRSFEDAYNISESAAKKLATERLYGFDQDSDNGVELNRAKYLSVFPDVFTKKQLDMVGDDGVVKKGTVLNYGDPIILATGPKILSAADAQLGKLHKTLRNSLVDKATVWEHKYPGYVVDTATTQKGAKVNIKATSPVDIADKLSTFYGLKGVCGTIIKDDEMPRDPVTNEPYELLLNPMGVLSRVAPAQAIELALGKLAKHTGQQIKIPHERPPEGWAKWAKGLMEKAGLPVKEKVFDPRTGKMIKPVGTGYSYVMAFHHLADKKLSNRGHEGSYTMDHQPARGGKTGSKRFSGQDTAAALAHGATELIRDAHLIRGTKNDDYWRALRMGRPLPEPDKPFIYDKFINTLRAGGINVTDRGDTLSIMPMVNEDIAKLSKGEIKSADLLDKNFKPVPGGLFDPGITGGTEGNRWSHIKLPEPLPNPVMEEPVRRLLGLTKKRLRDVIAGREEIDGKTGGVALKAALEKINIDDMIQHHLGEVKRLRGSNRDNSVKILGYLKSAKDQGLHPSQWMLDKLPVLPPMFRPVARLGDLPLVPSLNQLYADIINHKENLIESAADLPRSELADDYETMYDAAAAAIGLGEPITPEGRAHKLKGAIRQVIGDNPKTGMFQGKVLSKTVGGVGRAVVTPDPNYGMDTMGIPEDSAWTLYHDYVMRRLVQRGYPPVRALQMLEERDDTARQFLVEEMDKRPVIVNRAPVWHKFNLMAFRPHIVEGQSLRVSPLICESFNMDFDGNCVTFDTELIISLSKSMFDINSIEWYYNLIVNANDKGGYSMSRVVGSAEIMLDVDDFPDVIHTTIGNIPRMGTPVKDKNGADVYRIPPGVSIYSYDHDQGKSVFKPISVITVEEGCNLVKVKTTTKSVKVSDNESLAVFDYNTGKLIKCAPKDALGKSVPVVKKPWHSGTKWNRDFGWFIGAYLSDGWLSSGMVGYAKTETCKREEFERVMRQELTYNFTRSTHTATSGDNKYGDSVKIHCTGKELVEAVTKLCLSTANPDGKRQALTKRLPAKYLLEGSEEFLYGVLSGLLDGDGSIGVRNNRYTFKLNTSSPALCKGIEKLLYYLGIRYSTTISPPRGKSNEAYIIIPSTVDMYTRLDRLTCVGKREREILYAFKNNKPSTAQSKETTPVTGAELDILSKLFYAKKEMSMYTCLRKNKRVNTYLLGKFLRTLAETEREGLTDLYKRVYNDNIRWDCVTKITPIPTEPVYDVDVADTKVFEVNNGLIIWDTSNFHVPVSDEAVEQAFERMLPSKNLTRLTDLSSPMYTPRMEMTMGLYWLTQKAKNGKPVVFNTLKEAKQAYREGRIDVNTPIVINEQS